MKKLAISSFCFLFLNIFIIPLSAQIKAPIIGLKSNFGFLINNDRDHPIVNSNGIFAQIRLKRFSLLCSHSIGKNSFNKQRIFTFSGGSFENFGNFSERFITITGSVKIHAYQFNPKCLIFFGTGTQLRKVKTRFSKILSNTTIGPTRTSTYEEYKIDEYNDKTLRFHLSCGLDYYFEDYLFLSGQLGLTEVYKSSTNTSSDIKSLNNIFFELQIGYLLFHKRFKQ